MSFPVFASGDVLNASDMNGVGLWLIKTQTVGSNVASVTVTGAFSADYDNYLITYEGAVASATGEALRLQLGSTTTGYYGNLIYANFASGAPASVGDNNTANWTHMAGANNSRTNASINVMNPFRTVPTHVFSYIYADNANGGSKRGYLNNSLSYTDFTLLGGNTGNLTGGTIRVYGYRN